MRAKSAGQKTKIMSLKGLKSYYTLPSDAFISKILISAALKLIISMTPKMYFKV